MHDGLRENRGDCLGKTLDAVHGGRWGSAMKEVNSVPKPIRECRDHQFANTQHRKDAPLGYAQARGRMRLEDLP
jgi:hypothetical protein